MSYRKAFIFSFVLALLSLSAAYAEDKPVDPNCLEGQQQAEAKKQVQQEQLQQTPTDWSSFSEQLKLRFQTMTPEQRTAYIEKSKALWANISDKARHGGDDSSFSTPATQAATNAADEASKDIYVTKEGQRVSVHELWNQLSPEKRQYVIEHAREGALKTRDEVSRRLTEMKNEHNNKDEDAQQK
jgi:hypothetical protein